MATLTRPEGTEPDDLALSRRAVLTAAGLFVSMAVMFI